MKCLLTSCYDTYGTKIMMWRIYRRERAHTGEENAQKAKLSEYSPSVPEGHAEASKPPVPSYPSGGRLFADAGFGL